MNTTGPSFLLIAILAAIGCQKPCATTTFNLNPFTGDTIFIERIYTSCGDTLNYYERQVKTDSTILSEGEMVNGKKEGVWKTNAWKRALTDYRQGIAVKVEQFHDNGKLMQEEVLGSDSLYEVRSFNSDGILVWLSFKTLDGYLTGQGVEYDTLGRKSSEGEYIAEPCLTDTIYLESPDPPYDLQLTIITENGGKHGPWINFDGEGNVTDTTMFDHGVPVREEINLKTGWNGQGSKSDLAVKMVEPNLKKPKPLGEGIKEFEGRITYKVEDYSIIRGKGWSLVSKGTKLEIFYKEGKWLEKSNGKSFDWQLYLTDQNRHYTSNTLFEEEARITWLAGGYLQDASVVLHVEVTEHAEKILGYDCDQLILYTKWDTAEYFFSRDLPINYRHFEKCRVRHFNVWTRYAQSMPLKMVFATTMMGKMKYTLTATSIQAMKIDDRVFTMPIEGRKTEPDWTDSHLEFIKSGGF